MIKAYAGIGSRSITDSERQLMIRIGVFMRNLGYVLYSGNAQGSDDSFQIGADGKCVSFHPWKGYNTVLRSKVIKCFDISPEAYKSVSKHHPRGSKLSATVQRLMARNYQIICGVHQLPQVDMVIYCANEDSDGVKGGTGQGVRIATALGIPTINIRKDDWKDKMKMYCTKSESHPEIDEILKLLGVDGGKRYM